MFTFLLGLAVFGGVLAWLYRLKRRDVEDCGIALGLAPAPARSTRGTTSEGFSCHDSLVLTGTLGGCAAESIERRVRYNFGRPKRVRRNQGSLFTVLQLTPATPRAVTFRLQPAGMLRVIEQFQGEAPPIIETGDADFDAAYRLYTPDPAGARAVLTTARRQAILALRLQAGVPLPHNLAGAMTSALVLGTIEVAPSAVSYSLFGSPARKTAAHIAAAVPVLTDLAR